MADLSKSLRRYAPRPEGVQIPGLPGKAPSAAEASAEFIRGMPERRLSADTLAADNTQTFFSDLGLSSPFNPEQHENQQLRDQYNEVGLRSEVIQPPSQSVAAGEPLATGEAYAQPKPSLPIGYGPPTGMRGTVTNPPGSVGVGLTTGTMGGINPLETNPMRTEDEQQKKGAGRQSVRG